MSINTDLNIFPYFDDFDESKQFNRLLFNPGRALQARELTQLQTVLQNQVERFGSNIYKEGTIISGVNLTERSDISFVKIKDASNFTDPTIYNPTSTEKYILVGETSGLEAEIILSENGFETRAPNLKTFFIKYLNTKQSSDIDVKTFQQGEILAIKDSNGIAVSEPDSNSNMTVTVASISDHVGKSFGVSINEGIIYQRGHFIFVEEQSVIVSKYTNSPSGVSVGFIIQENIVKSSQDSSLLDNAQGFNNVNAPGADRLQLKPILTSLETGSEVDDFFTLIRYDSGEASSIRDVTQFNSIATEMAKRTYEESGNYVVNGLNLSLEDDSNNTYVVISPGKAYSFGYGIENISNKYLTINASSDTKIQNNQSTGIDYGSYYNFVWKTLPNQSNNDVLDSYVFDGTRYDLRDSSNTVIGKCSIRNVTPGVDGSKPGKIHVYAIEKNAGEENTIVSKIGNTPVFGNLKEANSGANIFKVGKTNLKSASNFVFKRRLRKSISGNTTNITIAGTLNQTPQTTNIFATDSVNNIISVSSIAGGSNTVSATLSANNASYIYYDVIDTSTSADDLTEIDMYVNSTFNPTTGIAYIGVPNALRLLSVIDSTGSGEDVTSKFRLVNNQKEGFYDISYIKLKSGESAPSDNNLQIKAKVLRRTSTLGGSYLSINSYNNVNTEFVSPYTSKSGETFDLLSCYDFRPYATPWVSYSVSTSGAQTATPTAISLDADVTPSTKGLAIADLEYYLSRVDSVVIDSTGNFDIVEGSPDENPVTTNLNNAFEIGEIYVPGNKLNITGQNPVKVVSKKVKNYTMKDIGKIDKKIERLTETVSLSLLEQNTRDMFIPDANGLNRFKNGILVDSFKNFKVADLKDAEYSAAIDRGYRVCMPKVKQFPVDLKLSSTSNTTAHTDIVTLGDSGTLVKAIEQPFGTNVRNAVSNFYLYNGQSFISPQFDSGYNVVQNPAINLEIDIASPLLDLIDNIQEFVPLTSTSIDRITNIDTQIGIQGSNITTTTNTTISTDSLESNSIERTDNIGSFVTDVTFNPYMQSREVKILVTGLRPNTRHYFFFGETDVNSHVIPAEIVTNEAGVFDVRNVQASKRSPGGTIRTDNNGVLAAIFVIPENTFFVGETDIEISDVSQYTSIESGGTSYSRIAYRAYNFTVDQTLLNSTTRSVDFDVTSNTTTNQSVSTRFVPTPNNRGFFGGDPLSQTFFIKAAMAKGASSIFVKELDLYFQTKSSTNGITVELREVVNGYPSSQILPFGKKHLNPSQINVSSDGSTVTTVSFDNPIKLSIEKEYAFVIMPDGNDPNYLVYTSKVGGRDLITSDPVTQDWGDGVLFTSTNNKAWQSVQDEDVKFTLKRLDFNVTTGKAILVPNDLEFLSVSNTVNSFKTDEIVYSEKSTSYSGVGISGRTFTVASGSVNFNVGDYVRLVQGNEDHISKIESINSGGGSTVVTLESPHDLDEESAESVNAVLIVVGKVSYFNDRNSNEIHLKESSARENSVFESNTSIVGYRSGATATIENINSVDISYFQPLIFVDNTSKTKTTARLMDGNTANKSISLDKNVWLSGNPRTITSKSSDIVNNTNQDFRIEMNLENQGFSTTSPILDSDISILNVYQYYINDDVDKSSKYVSKEVILQEDMEAIGLKVYLSAYRPPGTMIDVYSRFVYSTDTDNVSDWIKLENENSDLYSNIANTMDYREFVYNLTDETKEYNSFQMKIVMRHPTTSEKENQNITSTNSVSLFPHLYDFRAIALT